MAAYIDTDSLRVRFKVSDFQSFQLETLKCLLKKNDVFLSAKTGAGKSLCYQAFQPAWVSKNDEPCIVLIVAPLISIMKEQCEFLTTLGFSATYIGKDKEEEDNIVSGKYEFLFASPEQLLSTSKWRDMMLSDTGKCIRLLVVDEAHTVLQWGEADTDQDAFRSWFGRLGELRSLLECPVLLITATANKSARKQLQQKFCMINCHELIDNPDRPNIKLFMVKYKSTEPLQETFYFLIQLLQEKHQNCDRYVIFCPSIKACSDLYTMFRLELGSDIKHIQMYHSSTTDVVKENIKTDLSHPDGIIRILIATSAAGMGVNFAAVKGVINFGPPKDMDTFVQQFGRAGRDGCQATALLLFNAKQCKNIDSDMKEYVSNISECRRKKLLSFYNSAPTSNITKHACCDICAKYCTCDTTCLDIKHPYFEIQSQCSSSDSDLEDTELVSESD